MRHKVSNIFCSAAVLGLTLSATGCGGGSSSSASIAVAPAPTPSPTPTPTPTPSPSPTPTSGPLAGPPALTQVQDFAVLGYSVTGSTDREGRGGPLVQQPGGVAIRYIASDGRHELMIPGREWGTLGTAFTNGGDFSSQSVTVGTGATAFAYRLALFVPGDRNRTLPLVHTSYGSWEASAINPTDPNKIDQNYGTFAYGVPTQAGGVPRVGMATYRGVVFDPYSQTGTVNITIDFATRQVTGSIEPFFNDGIGGVESGGSYPFSGSLQADASAFQASFPIGSTGRTGLLEVQLTGPTGEELMLRWSASIIVRHLRVEPIAFILPGVARRN